MLTSGRKPWFLGAGALVLTGAAFAIGRLLSGGAPTASSHTAKPGVHALLASPAQAEEMAPLPEAAEPDPASVVMAQRKRIMGRLRSLENVRRTATQIRPLVDRALAQSAVQPDLRALARMAGMQPDEYRRYFAGKQEADLLLESGGDPNARSVSDAIGVAQFLASTGRRAGLKVDLPASNRLSRSINELERQMEWLSAQPFPFSRPVPPVLVRQLGLAVTLSPAPASAPTSEAGDTVPSVVPAPASVPSAAAAPVTWTRDQWLDYRRKQWRTLVAKRRTVDHRFDPVKAITAQSRYLVRLTRRYGGVDWALQAYHGGEAGASRTLGLFTASMGRSSFGSRSASFHAVPYTELYRRVTPRATPAAFSYLFGRSDDHRYYWWKVLMAEQVLDLYRSDAAEFERQWQALKPGYSTDVVYYPEPASLQFEDNEALRVAYLSQELVPLPAGAAAWGIRTANLSVLEPESASLFKGLRPEAMGTLLRLGRLYREHGGKSPLTAVAMVQTNEYRRLWIARYPQQPLPRGTPRDPEYHSTGLVFDLQRPKEEWDRKVLEYALGRLYDSLRVSWRKENEAGSQRYHVVVNPSFRDEMIDYYRRAAGRAATASAATSIESNATAGRITGGPGRSKGGETRTAGAAAVLAPRLDPDSLQGQLETRWQRSSSFPRWARPWSREPFSSG